MRYNTIVSLKKIACRVAGQQILRVCTPARRTRWLIMNGADPWELQEVEPNQAYAV